MSSVKIYEDFFSKEEILKIQQTFEFSNTFDQRNILKGIKKLNMIELIYNLAVLENSTVSEPSLAQLITIEKYNEKSSTNMYWEPHHDGDSSKVITLIFVDIDNTKQWVGGELDVYDTFNLDNWPKNRTRIQPRPGNIAVFDSSLVHCIRPYFGKTPRKTISIGWN